MARPKSSGSEGPSKMSLVRDAIAAIGGNPKPKAIHAYIKEHNGTDLAMTIVSSYKSMITKKGGKSAKVGRPAGSGKPGRPAGSGGGGTGGVSVDDIVHVKDLMVRLGSGKLEKLISALSK